MFMISKLLVNDATAYRGSNKCMEVTQINIQFRTGTVKQISSASEILAYSSAKLKDCLLVANTILSFHSLC